MSGEFKFKYLDACYIKRLQQNANKKLHGERNEDEIKSILKKSNKSVRNVVSKTNDSEQHGNGQKESTNSPETTSGTIKFKNKVTSLSPHNHTSPRSKYNSNLLPNAAESPKVSKIKVQALSPRQTRFDENEPILSKITCSQRTICTVIDSLLPNLIEKPHFDTPMEAERCRKRFEAFLRMFTRNYSYPIELMLTDIQSSRSYSPASLAFKINSLHNILQVALSAYTTNVRNYLDHGIPPKIVDLLNSIQQTTLICIDRMLFDEDDYIVQFVLDKMNEVLMDLESIRHGKWDYQSKAQNIEVNATKKRINRLCMYGLPSTQTNVAQKRSVQLKWTKTDKEIKKTSPTSATVLTTANQNDVSNRQRKQQQYQQNQKTVKTSRSHSINVRIPKCVKQPAFEASQDKINIAKRKFNTNNQKFDVIAATANNITTSIQCCPLNNRTVVDSANRTASGLMVEKELFKCKNTKYSQVISQKDVTCVDSHPNFNHLSNEDARADDVNHNLEFNAKSMQMSPMRNQINTNRKQMKQRKVNLLTLHRRDASNQLISRVSEELDVAPTQTFHKSLDLGERLFIETFLALEINI